MEERLRFAVLGSVRAWRGTDEIDIGPPQQRTVLAVLLLAEGSQVLTSELVDAVWGTRAPASAPGILRTYIHWLRKALEPASDTAPSVIRSTGNGYQLLVPSVELDLSAFRELLAQAEQARLSADALGAAKYLRDALGLWRGTALAGLRGEYAQTQRQRLSELRLSAQVSCIRAELGLGAHAKAAADLTGLVAEHPLDERFRELMMLALYRSGRQAAALETYREVQILLADELGVDPGPALQEMYQRVLRADARLLAPQGPAESSTPAAVVPAQLPAGLEAFVGREAELSEVTRLLPRTTVLVKAIAGMAGVGKTAFAVHWARQVADQFPDGQLYLNLRGFDPGGPPVTPEHALRTLLESLGADPRGLPQETDALAARFRTLLAGRRMLLLLDNARDAAQVRPLLPGGACLVIVTSRNSLAGLVAVNGAHPIALGVLSVPEARALLERRLGTERVAAEPDAVEEIIARCARLPLALAVTSARAATMSELSLEAIAAELRSSAGGLDSFYDGDTSADVRAVFSWSYHALSADGAHLFRLLALHPGPDIAVPAAASLIGCTLAHARRLLSELVQAHMVRQPSPGRYACHDLLRAYATELLNTVDPPEETHAARHRMFDHYLHTAFRVTAQTSRARALISLAPVAEGVSVDGFEEDAAKATAWFTAEQAVLISAVGSAAAHRYDVHTWQLAWAISSQLHVRGLWRELEAVRLTAMDAGHRLSDQAAQADAHHGLAIATAGLGRHDEARVHAELAVGLFAASGHADTLSESYCTLAWVAQQQGDPAAALHAAQQALTIHRAHEGHGADDHRSSLARAVTLNTVGWCHALLGQNQRALVHCRQALILHQRLGDKALTAHTWDSIGHAQHRLGQNDQATVSFSHALALYREHGGLPRFIAGTLKRLGDTHLSAGRPEAARAAWSEGLDVMERLDHADAEADALRNRLDRLWERDEVFS
ncbi:BTAD domain-containing putative transcriptional regulator [Streptomyces sp. NPDC000618]|uniref:AfsR/SARP family transcriptional regulator n=1 Tax=Streptomyces sp. NPDC000618 TaxID=3154265 RepID=UPI00332C1DA9